MRERRGEKLGRNAEKRCKTYYQGRRLCYPFAAEGQGSLHLAYTAAMTLLDVRSKKTLRKKDEMQVIHTSRVEVIDKMDVKVEHRVCKFQLDA